MDPAALQALYERARESDASRAAARSSLGVHLEAHPADAPAWLVLGMLATDAGASEDARSALTHAVQLAPDEAFARLLLAGAHEACGDLDAASRELQGAADRSSSDPVTLAAIEHRQGLLSYRRGAYDAAERHLAAAARGPLTAGERARIAYARGLVHEASREPGALLAAAAAYREAVAHDASLVDAFRALSDALATMGEHGEALSALAAVLRQAPDDERALRNHRVLTAALAELRARRLVLGPLRAVETSVLAEAAKLTLVSQASRPESRAGGQAILRYEGPLLTLDVSASPGGVVRDLFFALRDPEAASASDGSPFGVTVLATSGTREVASYATAASVTFLREALGVPMTEAAALYGKLLAGAPSVTVDGVRAAFATRAGAREAEQTFEADRPGLLADAVEAYPRPAPRPPRSDGGPSAPSSSSDTKPPRATTT